MTTPTPEMVLCPVCGSADLIARNDKRKIGDRFTGSILIDEIVYSCSNCGAEGDFADQNDDIYKRAVEAMSAKAMGKMLEALNDQGISMAEFERKLSLPQRTTARWKREGASAAATTLVKAVITYPWILDVSKTNFDPIVANQALMQESFKITSNWAQSLRISSSFMEGMFNLPNLTTQEITWEVGRLKNGFLHSGRSANGLKNETLFSPNYPEDFPELMKQAV